MKISEALSIIYHSLLILSKRQLWNSDESKTGVNITLKMGKYPDRLDIRSKHWIAKHLPKYYRIVGHTKDATKALGWHRLENEVRDITIRNNTQIAVVKANKIKQGKELSIPVPLKCTPYKHQVRAFYLGITLPQVAFLMEQGTGKTLPAIAVAGYRFLKGQITRLLVICPLSVVSEWKRQFYEHADFPFYLEVLAGDAPKLKRRLSNWADGSGLQVVVINYEATWNLTRKQLESGEYSTDWEVNKELVRWKADMVICDESQRIKNHTTHQSKATFQIGKKSEYRMILTGTPITRSPLDFFGQYRFLNHTIFGLRFPAFRDKYARFGGYMGKQIVGFRKLDGLAKMAHSIAYRVTKKEALDLPPVVDEYIYARLEPSARKIYDEMEKEFIVFLESAVASAPIALTQLLRLQQITGGFLPFEEDDKSSWLHPVSKAKLKVLSEVLDDLFEDPNRKVVIFARFIPEIEAISNMLKSKRVTHFTMDGGTPANTWDGKRGVKPDSREDLVNRFQTTNHARAFVIQIATGGIGITLTAADTEIFYSVDSLEHYTQAKARLDRIGQTHEKVTCIHILAEDTVDEKVMKRLGKQQDIATMVVDNLREMFLKEKVGKNNKGEKKLKVKIKKKAPVVKRPEPTIESGLKESDKTREELDELLTELEQELSKATSDKNNTIIEPSDAPESTSKKSGKEIRSDKKQEQNNADKKPSRTKPVDLDSVITVKDLADELSIEPRKLRKWLRTKYGGAEGRWEWSSDDPMLETIRADYKGA